MWKNLREGSHEQSGEKEEDASKRTEDVGKKRGSSGKDFAQDDCAQGNG
jgi:hypothetical protein